MAQTRIPGLAGMVLSLLLGLTVLEKCQKCQGPVCAEGGPGASRRNVIIFVADGLRAGSVNAVDAPTLWRIRQEGVYFSNSHSLFPTFTTPNASAIATGHYLGDTGDFSNVLFTGYLVRGETLTPSIENDSFLADIDEHFPGNNFLDEESLLAFARAHGYQTAAVGKLGPALLQDVTQGNSDAGGTVPAPETIIIDDSTGSTEAKTGRTLGISLNPEIARRLIKSGLVNKEGKPAAPDRSNGSPRTQKDNGYAGTNDLPGTLAANTVQQQYFADAVTKVVLPFYREQKKPFALVYWSRDPDGTQHHQGDSLNALVPGINGPTSKAAIKNTDANLKQILDFIEGDPNLKANTDIFVTADHGFSTISKRDLDNTGANFTTSYAATQIYKDSKGRQEVNTGFLPLGFVAIDLAHELGLPLYDADTQEKDSAADLMVYKPVVPAGQRPRNGNGLIGGNGLVKDRTDASVVVAANGGSDLIYVPSKDPDTVKKVVDLLLRQDYTSGLFVDDAFGSIPGTLPISFINLKGSAVMPAPSIIVNFRTFSTDASHPFDSEVELADSSLQQGQGMHGSFGRGDTFNNMAAIGPDFKQGFVDRAPVSNADVAITLASILRFDIPNKGTLRGRVLKEALAGEPERVEYKVGSFKSAQAAPGNVLTYVNFQQVGDTRYFDAAGFEGRTVGLLTASPP